ncbi:hypothetical protein GTQ99_00480 [Kineococcus sp. T13]|uniref:hypothetical protein n=1 Tax=Kineococcus vitellinus TaxID=2696565 RepID=UPI00141214C1|nr:hypothetical protein [Kineococcus vitellinus]NAZ73907.1 hypothetical protein [Kineococcus vitellinus]
MSEGRSALATVKGITAVVLLTVVLAVLSIVSSVLGLLLAFGNLALVMLLISLAFLGTTLDEVKAVQPPDYYPFDTPWYVVEPSVVVGADLLIVLAFVTGIIYQLAAPIIHFFRRGWLGSKKSR